MNIFERLKQAISDIDKYEHPLSEISQHKMSQPVSEEYAEEYAEIKRLCNELDAASDKVLEVVDAAIAHAGNLHISDVSVDLDL